MSTTDLASQTSLGTGQTPLRIVLGQPLLLLYDCMLYLQSTYTVKKVVQRDLTNSTRFTLYIMLLTLYALYLLLKVSIYYTHC